MVVEEGGNVLHHVKVKREGDQLGELSGQGKCPGGNMSDGICPG